MPKPRQYRWVCPLCGAGKLAPSRPRKNDVRRYCLACSERTGKLVERLSPALERQRQERQERIRRKARTKRDRERKQHTSYRQSAQERAQAREAALGLSRPLDWYRARMVRLKTWKGARLYLDQIKVKVRWSEEHSDSSGHAKRGWMAADDRSMVTLTIGKGETGAGALRVLLHELAHQASYVVTDVCETREWHGESYKRLLIDACEELTGQKVDALIDAGHCYTTVDPACQKAIAAWLEGGTDG